VDTGRACSLLLTSPLAASQNFEVRHLFYSYQSLTFDISPVQNVQHTRQAIGSVSLLAFLCIDYHFVPRVSSVTFLCYLVLSALTDIKLSSTDQMVEVRWRRTSKERPCMVAEFVVQACSVGAVDFDK
jgi:hypothetical protein